ncbi:MAG: tetratricopeptide repeat protein [Acidobacteriota bacterium]|nr:tetratricopeptide repeat protein [Acidobacteriota bacterium]
MMKVKTVQFLLGILLLSCLVPSLQAQIGNIRGKVMDQSGNPLEDVLITIQSLVVSREYEVRTDAKGEFYHGGVTRQGTYRVIAEKEGFQRSYVEGLRAATDRKGGDGLVEFTLVPGRAGKLAFELTDDELKAMEESAEDSAQRAAVAEEVKLSLNEGLNFYNQGQYEQALTAFNAALEMDDQQPALWANLGNTHDKLNQSDQAVEAYSKAIAIAPEDPTLYQNQANIYAAMGNTDKARELYEQAVQLSAYGDPKDAAINYYNMGVTFINSGQTDDAIEALTKAIESDPDYTESYYQLGICFLGTGQMDASLKNLSLYLEISPDGPNAGVAKQLVDSLQ